MKNLWNRAKICGICEKQEMEVFFASRFTPHTSRFTIHQESSTQHPVPKENNLTILAIAAIKPSANS